MVRLYGYDDCPFCKELKGYLDENSIKYKYVDVTLKEHKEEKEKIFELIGEEVVPVAIVGKKVLVPNRSFKTIKEGFELINKLLK